MGAVSIVALSLSMALLWAPYRYAWAPCFAVFLVTGLYSSWITVHALFFMAIALSVIYASIRVAEKRWRYGLNTAVVVLALVAGFHIAPGFSVITLYENTVLSDKTAWSGLYFTADKPVFGLFLLLAYRDRLCRTISTFVAALKTTAPSMVVGISVVYALALGLGYVEVDATASALVILWCLRNLFFTVIAEEVFFRGFVQHKLTEAIAHRHAVWLSLAVTSVFFGAVHLYGGWQYALLAMIAGLMYGYVYVKSGRLEMAIVGHLALNTGHVLLLSYP